MIFDSRNGTEKDDLSRVSTDQIINQIKEAPVQFSQEKLDMIQSKRFEDYLRELMEKYHCTPGQMIIRTCLSKPFVYQILKGERVPGRDVILRICFALKADLDETQRLLTLAEKGVLYPKVKRDAAILCCIESGKSLEYTNMFLEEHGEKKLL
ncbi:MAG: helix-turn-helix transcriptional regulator [Eubacteriales bacterium]|nr:helix-turn-helix transcriptional regulator [Eubacteriales bacterium]